MAKDEYIECPHCGKEFSGSVPVWLRNLKDHLIEEHDDHRLAEEAVGAPGVKRNHVKNLDYLKIQTRTGGENNSQGDDRSDLSGQSLAEKRAGEETAQHGIQHEKYSQDSSEDREKSREKSKSTSEVDDEQSGFNFSNLLPASDKVKTWGGRALVAISLALGGWVAYQKFISYSQNGNEAGEGEAGTSSTGGETEETTDKETASQRLDNKGNGKNEDVEKKDMESPSNGGYRTFEDL